MSISIILMLLLGVLIIITSIFADKQREIARKADILTKPMFRDIVMHELVYSLIANGVFTLLLIALSCMCIHVTYRPLLTEQRLYLMGVMVSCAFVFVFALFVNVSVIPYYFLRRKYCFCKTKNLLDISIYWVLMRNVRFLPSLLCLLLNMGLALWQVVHGREILLGI